MRTFAGDKRCVPVTVNPARMCLCAGRDSKEISGNAFIFNRLKRSKCWNQWFAVRVIKSTMQPKRTIPCIYGASNRTTMDSIELWCARSIPFQRWIVLSILSNGSKADKMHARSNAAAKKTDKKGTFSQFETLFVFCFFGSFAFFSSTLVSILLLRN